MKKLFTSAALAVSSSAFAAPNTAAIEAAQADLLVYAGAMLTLGIAVWGLMKAVRMFRGT